MSLNEARLVVEAQQRLRSCIHLLLIGCKLAPQAASDTITLCAHGAHRGTA